MPSTNTLGTYDDLDLSSEAFWAQPAIERDRTFSLLREKRPVSWHRPMAGLIMEDPDDVGFWAVVGRDDIVEISRRNDVFVSGEGVFLYTMPPEHLVATQSFLGMDPPRHTKLRKLVSAAFTPKQARRISDQIDANAEAVVRELAASGSGADFVENCAAQLPLRTLSDMVGIPPELRPEVAHCCGVMISVADRSTLGGRDPLVVLAEATTRVIEIAIELAEQRRRDPREDLMTNLVQAEVEGERLTNEEIAAFFTLLSVAGNDTTRQTTSHVLKALTDFPDQREWLMADFDGRIGTAVEEFVRWATPVMTFRRTAIVDTELHGQQIAAGDKLVMFYASGNRDERVFDDPHRFDLSRDPNPHVGFGGGGVHFCLGSHIAKAQLRAIFRELLHQLPDVEAGSPQYLASPFIDGISAMPCTFTLP